MRCTAGLATRPRRWAQHFEPSRICRAPQPALPYRLPGYTACCSDLAVIRPSVERIFDHQVDPPLQHLYQSAVYGEQLQRASSALLAGSSRTGPRPLPVLGRPTMRSREAERRAAGCRSRDNFSCRFGPAGSAATGCVPAISRLSWENIISGCGRPGKRVT